MIASWWNRLLGGGRSTAASLPETARYRRAVGLELRLRPCDGCATVQVTARRHGKDHTVSMALEDAAQVVGMTEWRRAQEVGVAPATLARHVADHLLFWADGMPAQRLSGAPLATVSSGVALRRNVWATPIMELEGRLEPVPFMPRMGQLKGARLVGMHFGVMEFGQQVMGVGLSCCTRHAYALMDLLPLLDGHHTLEELASVPDGAALTHVLGALTLLETRGPDRTNTPSSSVTWWGHAAVLLEIDGTRVMVDPLFHPSSDPPRDPTAMPPDPRALGHLDAVLITHGDNDHLNPQALARMDRRTRIIVPAVVGAPPHQVDMVGMLRVLGFSNVTEAAEWERFSVGKLTVVAAPFVGEDWGLTLANRTYLVHGGEGAVYLNADCAPMPDVYRRIAEEVSIDLVCVGVGGCEEARVMPPGYGYGNFYARFMDQARRNEWLQLCSGPDEAADAALQLRARHVFGYAAGGAPFIATAYTDRGDHAQLADALSRRGEGARARALPLGVPVPLKG